MKLKMVIIIVMMYCTYGWGEEKQQIEEALRWTNAKEIHIKEHQLPFYTYFDMDSDDSHLGTVIKEQFEIWTHYGYYANQRDKDLIAKAYIRLLSFGQLFSWSSVIDIYTPSGTNIGTIEGCWFTLSSSKFIFYNCQRQQMAIGYMNHNKTEITLYHPETNEAIARYQRHLLPLNAEEEKIVGYWKLDVYKNNIIPKSFLILFGAFAVDHESHFEILCDSKF